MTEYIDRIILPVMRMKATFYSAPTFKHIATYSQKSVLDSALDSDKISNVSFCLICKSDFHEKQDQ